MIASLLPLLLLGCPHKAGAPPVEPSLVIEAPPEVPVGEPVSPGPWQDPAGILDLVVPDGWTGLGGPPASSLVLTLDHPSGLQVQVWEFAGSGQVGPRPRPGCDWIFTDEGRHRLVPALAPAITATCLGEDPHAPIVQGWYGRVRGREVHVEVLYPANRMIEGRSVVEPLLEGIVGAGSAAPAQHDQGGG